MTTQISELAKLKAQVGQGQTITFDNINVTRSTVLGSAQELSL